MRASPRDQAALPPRSLGRNPRPRLHRPPARAGRTGGRRVTAMAAPAEDPAEAAADRSEVPDSLGGRQSFAPARPGVNVARGEDALRAYLAWDGHARAAHMDPDAFARWLEREVLQYLTANRASLLRARADGVRRLHAPTLDPLAHALERAEAEYRGSAEGARIERATHAVAQRRAAVAGIRSFLESTPATPELAAKQAAASDKLEHALASLPAAELELKDAVASSPLWRDVEHKRDALRAERERTGLASADDDARRASNLNGNSLVTKGDDYEKTCADVVADAFLASGGLIGGADGVPTDGVPTEGDGVLLLRNVTLGLHSGELDCVLVRVNRGVDHSGESAFADAIPQDGDGTTGRRTLARRGRTAATQPADDELKETRENSNSPPAPRPAVEVLAVFEFKRNPDDVARGFHSRQTTLAWLAGDEARYDPREWANRRHPSGHFRRGYHPMRLARWVKPPHETRGSVEADAKGGKVGKVLVLTRDSFRGFRRTHRDAQGRGGFYLDGVWLVTRPRTMCGLDAKLRAPLMEIAGSHVSAHVVQSCGGSVPSPEDFFLAVDALRRERVAQAPPSIPRDDPLRAKLRTLHGWVLRAVGEKSAALPNDTRGVLELYLDRGERSASQVLLVEEQPNPR